MSSPLQLSINSATFYPSNQQNGKETKQKCISKLSLDNNSFLLEEDRILASFKEANLDLDINESSFQKSTFSLNPAYSHHQEIITRIIKYLNEKRTIKVAIPIEGKEETIEISFSLAKLFLHLLCYANNFSPEKGSKPSPIYSVEWIGKSVWEFLEQEKAEDHLICRACIHSLKDTVSKTEIYHSFRSSHVQQMINQIGSDDDIRFFTKGGKVYRDAFIQKILHFLVTSAKVSCDLSLLHKELINKKEHYQKLTSHEDILKACLIEFKAVDKFIPPMFRPEDFNPQNQFNTLALNTDGKRTEVLIIEKLQNTKFFSSDPPSLILENLADYLLSPSKFQLQVSLSCSPFSLKKVAKDLLTQTSSVADRKKITEEHFVRFQDMDSRFIQEDLEKDLTWTLKQVDPPYIHDLIKKYFAKHPNHSSSILYTFRFCEALKHHGWRGKPILDKDLVKVWQLLEESKLLDIKPNDPAKDFYQAIKDAILVHGTSFSELSSYIQTLTFTFFPESFSYHDNYLAFRPFVPHTPHKLRFPFNPIQALQTLPVRWNSENVEVFKQLYQSYVLSVLKKNLPLYPIAIGIPLQKKELTNFALTWIEDKHALISFMGLSLYLAIPNQDSTAQHAKLIFQQLPYWIQNLDSKEDVLVLLNKIQNLFSKLSLPSYDLIVQKLKKEYSIQSFQFSEEIWIEILAQSPDPEHQLHAYGITKQKLSKPFTQQIGVKVFTALSISNSNYAHSLLKIMHKNRMLAPKEEINLLNLLCHPKTMLSTFEWQDIANMSLGFIKQTDPKHLDAVSKQCFLKSLDFLITILSQANKSDCQALADDLLVQASQKNGCFNQWYSRLSSLLTQKTSEMRSKAISLFKKIPVQAFNDEEHIQLLNLFCQPGLQFDNDELKFLAKRASYLLNNNALKIERSKEKDLFSKNLHYLISHLYQLQPNLQSLGDNLLIQSSKRSLLSGLTCFNLLMNHLKKLLDKKTASSISQAIKLFTKAKDEKILFCTRKDETEFAFMTEVDYQQVQAFEIKLARACLRMHVHQAEVSSLFDKLQKENIYPKSEQAFKKLKALIIKKEFQNKHISSPIFHLFETLLEEMPKNEEMKTLFELFIQTLVISSSTFQFDQKFIQEIDQLILKIPPNWRASQSKELCNYLKLTLCQRSDDQFSNFLILLESLASITHQTEKEKEFASFCCLLINSLNKLLSLKISPSRTLLTLIAEQQIEILATLKKQSLNDEVRQFLSFLNQYQLQKKEAASYILDAGLELMQSSQSHSSLPLQYMLDLLSYQPMNHLKDVWSAHHSKWLDEWIDLLLKQSNYAEEALKWLTFSIELQKPQNPSLVSNKQALDCASQLSSLGLPIKASNLLLSLSFEDLKQQEQAREVFIQILANLETNLPEKAVEICCHPKLHNLGGDKLNKSIKKIIFTLKDLNKASHLKLILDLVEKYYSPEVEMWEFFFENVIKIDNPRELIEKGWFTFSKQKDWQPTTVVGRAKCWLAVFKSLALIQHRDMLGFVVFSTILEKIFPYHEDICLLRLEAYRCVLMAAIRHLSPNESTISFTNENLEISFHNLDMDILYATILDHRNHFVSSSPIELVLAIHMSAESNESFNEKINHIREPYQQELLRFRKEVDFAFIHYFSQFADNKSLMHVYGLFKSLIEETTICETHQKELIEFVEQLTRSCLKMNPLLQDIHDGWIDILKIARQKFLSFESCLKITEMISSKLKETTEITLPALIESIELILKCVKKEGFSQKELNQLSKFQDAFTNLMLMSIRYRDPSFKMLDECLEFGLKVIPISSAKRIEVCGSYLSHYLSHNVTSENKVSCVKELDEMVLTYKKWMPEFFSNANYVSGCAGLLTCGISWGIKGKFVDKERFLSYSTDMLEIKYAFLDSKTKKKNVLDYVEWVLEQWLFQSEIIPLEWIMMTFANHVQKAIETKKDIQETSRLLDQFIYLRLPNNESNLHQFQFYRKLIEDLLKKAQDCGYFKTNESKLFEYSVFCNFPYQSNLSKIERKKSLENILNQTIADCCPLSINMGIVILSQLQELIPVNHAHELSSYYKGLLASIDKYPSAKYEGKLLFERLYHRAIPLDSMNNLSIPARKSLAKIFQVLSSSALKIAQNLFKEPIKDEPLLCFTYINLTMQTWKSFYDYEGCKNVENFFATIEKQFFPFLIPIFLQSYISTDRIFVPLEKKIVLLKTLINLILTPSAINSKDQKTQKNLLKKWFEYFKDPKLTDPRLLENAKDVLITSFQEAINQKALNANSKEDIQLFDSIKNWLENREQAIHKVMLHYMHIKFYSESLIKDYDAYITQINELMNKGILTSSDYNRHFFDSLIKLILNVPPSFNQEQQIKRENLFATLIEKIRTFVQNHPNDWLLEEVQEHFLALFQRGIDEEVFNEDSKECVKQFDLTKAWIESGSSKSLKVFFGLLDWQFYTKKYRQKNLISNQLTGLMSDLSDYVFENEKFSLSLNLISKIKKYELDPVKQKNLYYQWLLLIKEKALSIHHSDSPRIHVAALIAKAHHQNIMTKKSPICQKMLEEVKQNVKNSCTMDTILLLERQDVHTI